MTALALVAAVWAALTLAAPLLGRALRRRFRVYPAVNDSPDGVAPQPRVLAPALELTVSGSGGPSGEPARKGAA